MKEIIITKHWGGKTFNVNLVSWRGQEGVSFGRAFDVSKKEAEKEAQYQANLYKAKIVRKY